MGMVSVAKVYVAHYQRVMGATSARIGQLIASVSEGMRRYLHCQLTSVGTN
jgi:hypothetical protein